MRNLHKYFFLVICSLSLFFSYAHTSFARSINGAYDVKTSYIRDGGIISISVEGKFTKEGAERWSETGSSLYFRHFKIDGKTEAGNASILSNSYASKIKCLVKNTGSGIGNAKEGDSFFCSSVERVNEIAYGLEYGVYVFGITIGEDQINGKAKGSGGDAGDLFDENTVFVNKIPASQGTEDTIGDPIVSVSNQTVTITGTLNAKAAELADRNKSGFDINYGKIKKSSVKDFQYADLVKNVPVEIKKTGSTATFSATLKTDEAGEYAFGLHYSEANGSGGATFMWISPFSTFTANDFRTTLQLVSPVTPDESDPQNPKVTIKVLVNNITETGDGYIQLGHIELIGGSSNGRCVLDPSLTSDKLSIDKGGAQMHMEATFSGASKLTPGIYCIGAKAGSMEEFTSFTSKGDWFKIGNVVIPDTLTIDPNANQFGCVIPEGEDGSTTGYCLLAPLPGVGDETGYVDTSSGIEKYINSLIRLVLGLITVLSVLMIVVGGIEYMSTVNIGEKEGAKHRITQALLGLMVAIGSYAILNTINPNLVNITIHIPGAKIDYADNGETEDFEDPTAGISNTKPPVKPPTDVVIPDGDAVTLAKKVLENSNINLLENIPGRNEVSSGPKQNVTDTAAGKSVWRSSWGDKGHTQTNLSPKMLAGLLAIADKGIKIQVNALAGGDHASNSPHYQGLAFDLQASTTDLAKAKQIMGVCFAAGANYTGILGPCNNVFTKGKTTVCQATGYRTNEDHQTHIHCNWPGGTTTSTTTGGTVSGGTAGSCGLPSSKSSDMCEGVTKNCAKYAARIDELVKDPKRARFMKLNMVEESRCISDSVSPPTDSGYAYGIFQQQPETAKANVAGCGVSASQINGNWLRNENNIDKIICIQENLIKKLEAKCGTNIRNLGAGQHGIKWCEPSDFCSADKSCVPGNTYVMKWECPWNNKEHTELDSLAPARESSKQMQYCSDHPGSWMK